MYLEMMELFMANRHRKMRVVMPCNDTLGIEYMAQRYGA